MSAIPTDFHVIGVFYYNLGNLRPEGRGLLQRIELVALVKTWYISEYANGICKILEPFLWSQFLNWRRFSALICTEIFS